MNIVGIIPARYNSSRFPGKPLVNIDGKTMIERVYKQSVKSLKHVVVATDSQQIYDKVVDFGGKAVMTSSRHKSGTDRCFEALNIYQTMMNIHFDAIINIQGDEPFISPCQISLLKDEILKKDVKIATLFKRIEKDSELFDETIPKVVFDTHYNALYFSRSIIPFSRNTTKENCLEDYQYNKHIGIYAYKTNTLSEIVDLPIGKLEKTESLEQLRWLENAYKIRCIETNEETVSIDTKEDLLKLKSLGLIQ